MGRGPIPPLAGGARGQSIGIAPHVSVEKMKPVTRWSMRLRMDSNFQRPKAVSWAKVNTIFHDARQCGNIWRPALQVGALGDVALRPASDADADAAQCRAVPWHAPDMATTAAVSSRDATTAPNLAGHGHDQDQPSSHEHAGEDSRTVAVRSSS
jgi:hypothetical protein